MTSHRFAAALALLALPLAGLAQSSPTPNPAASQPASQPAARMASPGASPGSAPSTAAAASQPGSSPWPAAPAGFHWQAHKNAVFLRPDGWHALAADATGGDVPSSTYATSPEPFGPGRPFETGFTVQVISGSMRLKQVDARQMALVYLRPFLQSHTKDEVLMLQQSTRGDFERTVLRYRDAPPGQKPVIVHKFVLANAVTDSVHVFTFESPADTWEAAWARHGSVMMGQVSLLPGVPPH